MAHQKCTECSMIVIRGVGATARILELPLVLLRSALCPVAVFTVPVVLFPRASVGSVIGARSVY